MRILLASIGLKIVSLDPSNVGGLQPDFWGRTNIPLLQECKRICIWPANVVVEDICVALVVDVRPGEELYRCSDDAGDEEHEQDEGEQHHGAWEKLALRNVDDFDDDENYGKRADCDSIRHDPVAC